MDVERNQLLLYIVADIQDDTLSVKNTEGVGSEFIIRLPFNTNG